MTGCLLIHGYGGSPFEMEGLGEALDRAGYMTRVLTLPGHGEGFENFAQYRFADWLACAEQAYWELTEKCDRVVLVGFSMGGTLALNLAARFPVAAVVALCTPMYVLTILPWPLAHARFYALSGLTQARNLLRRLCRCKAAQGSGETSRDIAPWKGYGGPLHIKQLISFRKGCAATRALLSSVRAPLLVMQDERDELVYPGHSRFIVESVATEDPRLILTHMREDVTRHHMITTHRETREFVEKELLAFLREKGLDR